MILWDLCKFIGFVTVATALYRTFIWYVLPLIVKRPPEYYINRYGKDSYVVVTGASDGIGKGYCEVFARLGFNIVLIARNQTKTETVAKDVASRYKVKTKVIVADFVKSYEKDFYQRISEQVKSLDVSILVNNVGAANLKLVADTPEQSCVDVTIVNTLPIVMMTKLLLPQLQARKQRSAIIQVSSVSVVCPMPTATVYGATKIFDDYFGVALAMEISDKVDVQVVRPGPVNTNMTVEEIRQYALPPTKFVEDSLKHLGLIVESYGNWGHATMALISALIPTWIMGPLTMYSLRKKAAAEKKGQ
eukprot:TRINITY_DN8588_c0_g2_i2.p1 TRINITY_DN8588_c0_g2~~TRINITY_DN8588_c0_g2_i2.p1  ORF type:complete len:304 (-),score=54.28 TRINITY_DN8588_c0_g2_i2:183-1094(-)